MKTKTLHSNQILTLSDYPVHNEHILKMYHRMYSKGNHKALVPPLPVVRIYKKVLKRPGHGTKTTKYNNMVDNFFKAHSKTKFCLIDGTHKTTAAALCNKKIIAMIFEKNSDIREGKKMVERGDLFSLTTGDTKTINLVFAYFRKHFFKAMRLETVAEKTARMVENKILPRYMIKGYKKYGRG